MPTARHGLDSAGDGARWFVVGGGAQAGWRTFFTLSDRLEIYARR